MGYGLLISLTYSSYSFFRQRGAALSGWAMTEQLDANYYLSRLNAERAAAEAATSEAARAAHEELADHYLQLLAAAGYPPAKSAGTPSQA
jgi:hypothetical protein